jgi:hypothetical protein
MRISPVLQFDGRRPHFRDLIGGQQTEAIHQCQVCHATIVSQQLGKDWGGNMGSEGDAVEVAVLSRRPMKGATADQVNMEMKHRLARARSHVKDSSVAVFN